MQPANSHQPDSFAEGKFAYFPSHLAAAVKREWLRLRNRPLRTGKDRCGVLDDGREQEANLWLCDLVKEFPYKALDLGANEESLVQFAIQRAEEGRQLLLRDASMTELEVFCVTHGLSLPNGKTEAAIAQRVSCSLWWRRNLRQLNARKAEALSISLGLVHRQRGLYSSDDAVNRRRQQKRRNRALLDALMAINELGESFTLSDLADRGNANPAIKRAELMTRIAGFEYIALSLGLAGEFVTITAPSRYHPRRNKSGQRNPNYQAGLTPTDTRAYLGKVWSRITAALAREGIKIFGFRVAEPHHDGTPHFHGLFFLQPDQVFKFRYIVARHAVREDRAELGLHYASTQLEARQQARAQSTPSGNGTIAELSCTIGWESAFWEKPARSVWKAIKARVWFKAIDWRLGTAAGYIAKYIAKNIDGIKQTGESIGPDFEAQGTGPVNDGDNSRADQSDASQTAVRVDAWASTWGIRQFQQVGGPPVGIWRELRRWDYQQQDAEHTLMLAAAAADAGHWGRFVELMGGLEASRKDMPLTLAKEQRNPTNRYGEEAQAVAFGVVEKDSGQLAVSRMHEWTVFHGREADAWTRVYNSTKLKFTPETGPVITASAEQKREWTQATEELERRLAIQPDADDHYLPADQISTRRKAKQSATRQFMSQQANISQFAAQVERLVREAEAKAAETSKVAKHRRISRALLERITANQSEGILLIERVHRPTLPGHQPKKPRHIDRPSIAAQLQQDMQQAASMLKRMQGSPH